MLGEQIGNYQVVRVLGEGGMGTVYEAIHPIIGRRVALKVLRRERCDDEDLVRRFFAEARVVNDIRHEHIVEVLDLGQVPSGAYYLTMELLEGESLTERIARDGLVEPEVAVRVAMEVADALHAAHDKGVIHRDVKPDNVYLVRKGGAEFAKVLDFGIAKLVDESGSSSMRTRTGAVIGTPAYMSPEQCAGIKNIDHRSDCYSLGVVLFEMVTGQVPFEAEGVGLLLMKQMQEDPPPPSAIRPGIPSGLENVILKSLRKAPGDRYATMEEMRAALATCLDTDPAFSKASQPIVRKARPRTPPPTEVAEPPAAMAPPSPTTFSGSAGEAAVLPLRRQWMGLGIAGGVAVLGVMAFYMTRTGPPPPGPEPGVVASMAPAKTAPRKAEPGILEPAETPEPGILEPAETPEPGAAETGGPEAAEATEDAVPEAAPPAAEANNARVRIESRPPGALVRRAGDRTTLGRTPLDVELPYGEIQLTFEKRGYRAVRKSLTVDGEETLRVSLKRRKIRKKAHGARTNGLTTEL